MPRHEDEACTALVNARKTLLAGFTTVRDLGNDPRLIISLRDAIDRRAVRRPDDRRCRPGNQRSPAGTPTPRNGLNRDLYHVVNERSINTCNGADDCRRAVREQIGLGAEVIKITATGGVLATSPAASTTDDGR